MMVRFGKKTPDFSPIQDKLIVTYEVQPVVKHLQQAITFFLLGGVMFRLIIASIGSAFSRLNDLEHVKK
jgi:hypothetical protein